MRICLFASPRAVHSRRVIDALIDHGFRVHLVHRDHGEIPGASCERFAIPGVSLRSPHRWVTRRHEYLSRFFREFDVVGVFFLNDWGFDPEIIAQGWLAVWPWGSDVCPPPLAPTPSPTSLQRRRLLLGQADAVAACSDWFAARVAEFAGLERRRVQTVPLGVDPDLFAPTAPPPGQPVVGFLKGFGRAYGSDHLVRAMPRIISAVRDVTFEMVGDGPLLQPCCELAASLGVAQHVRWLSGVPHERVPEVLGRWQLSVIPSVCESFGVAALESSAMGVPVVASNVGGLPETVIDGQTGQLVPAGNSDALADAVIDLLRDRDRRVSMAEAGRHFVQERFHWRDCVSRWVAFFENAASVLEKCGSHSPL